MFSKPLSIALRVIAPVLIIGAGLLGYRVLANLKQDPERSRPETLAPLVQTVGVRPHTGELTIHVDGTVVPFRDVALSAEVPGQIVTKSDSCRAGRFVQAGEVLYEIDSEEYQLEVDRLTQLHGQSEAARDELDIEIENEQGLIEITDKDLALAVREHDRAKNLFADNAATEAQVDSANQMEQSTRRVLAQHQNTLRLKTAQRRRMEHGIELVAAQLKRAELDLARTQVVAPISGVVVSDHAEESAYVQKGAELVTIEDTSAVDVRCSLRMDELYWLWQHVHPEEPAMLDGEPPLNQQIQSLANRGIPQVNATVLYSLAGQQFSWQGQMSRYDGAGLDESTRTAACRLTVANPSSGSLRATSDGGLAQVPPALLRGMFVQIEFHLQPHTPLLRVPERAVRPGSVVWRVRDGKLERIAVHVARVVNGMALIPAPGASLSDQDRIVVSPLTTETAGQSVREKPIDET